MGKIKKIDLSRLRNNEHFELMRQVTAIITLIGAEVLRVAAQMAAFAAAIAREDEVLMQIKKSILTARINEADAARDDLYNGLLNTVRAASTHFTDAVRAAAAKLTIVLDTYGNLNRLAMAEQSSAVYNLCEDLLEKYPEEVLTLALTPWITALKNANKVVEDLMLERFDEGAGRTTLVMKDVRAEVDAAYTALADMLFVQGTVASLETGTDADALNAKYADAAGQWNQAIDRANNLVAARRGRSAAKKENETEIV